MSNTSIGRGTKGSKLWIQNVINDDAMRKALDHMIANEGLNWLSPLAPEYREYQLNEEFIYLQLGLDKKEAKALFSFWPNRQPQWDGIALSRDGKTLYIVEAKAHTSELESKCMAKSKESVEKIYASLKYVMKKYYNSDNFDAWINLYYQLANRLSFLNILNESAFGNIQNVKLVLLNFVDDYTYKPTTEQEWLAHYKEVFAQMTESENIPKNVILVNYKIL